MSQKLTETQLRLNVARHMTEPYICPVCGGHDGSAVVLVGDAYRIAVDGEVHLTQTVHCTCDASWIDAYRLAAVKIVEYGSRADPLPDPDKPVREFLKLVANLTKDGEIEVHKGRDVPYKQEPDDAIETLQSLITQARTIAKAADIDTGTYDAEVHIDA